MSFISSLSGILPLAKPVMDLFTGSSGVQGQRPNAGYQPNQFSPFNVPGVEAQGSQGNMMQGLQSLMSGLSMLIERLSGMVGLGANGSSVPADLATQGYAAPQEVEKPKKNWFSDILGIGVRAVAAFFTGGTSEAVAMTAASVVPSLLDGDN